MLRAKILPAGEVHITMRLRAIEDGCRVEMDEVAISGPTKLPPVVQQGLFAPGQRSSHSYAIFACSGYPSSRRPRTMFLDNAQTGPRGGSRSQWMSGRRRSTIWELEKLEKEVR